MNKIKLAGVAIAACLVMSAGGCGPEYVNSLFAKLRSPFAAYICKGAPQPGETTKGLVGRVFFDPTNQTYFDSLTTAFQSPFFSGIGLYVRELDILPSNFSVGYQVYDTENGSIRPLNRPTGGALIEHFGVRYRADIKVPQDEAGYYSFATVSDDGIELKIDGKTIIRNSPPHPPIVNCHKAGVPAVWLDENPRRLAVDWYQGPRFQIAAGVFYKPEPSEAVTWPSICGEPVLDFDPLFNEGFSILPGEHLYVPPEDNSYNPCNEL